MTPDDFAREAAEALMEADCLDVWYPDYPSEQQRARVKATAITEALPVLLPIFARCAAQVRRATLEEAAKVCGNYGRAQLAAMAIRALAQKETP